MGQFARSLKPADFLGEVGEGIFAVLSLLFVVFGRPLCSDDNFRAI